MPTQAKLARPSSEPQPGPALAFQERAWFTVCHLCYRLGGRAVDARRPSARMF